MKKIICMLFLILLFYGGHSYMGDVTKVTFDDINSPKVIQEVEYEKSDRYTLYGDREKLKISYIGVLFEIEELYLKALDNSECLDFECVRRPFLMAGATIAIYRGIGNTHAQDLRSRIMENNNFNERTYTKSKRYKMAKEEVENSINSGKGMPKSLSFIQEEIKNFKRNYTIALRRTILLENECRLRFTERDGNFIIKIYEHPYPGIRKPKESDRNETYCKIGDYHEILSNLYEDITEEKLNEANPIFKPFEMVKYAYKNTMDRFKYYDLINNGKLIPTNLNLIDELAEFLVNQSDTEDQHRPFLANYYLFASPHYYKAYEYDYDKLKEYQKYFDKSLFNKVETKPQPKPQKKYYSKVKEYVSVQQQGKNGTGYIEFNDSVKVKNIKLNSFNWGRQETTYSNNISLLNNEGKKIEFKLTAPDEGMIYIIIELENGQKFETDKLDLLELKQKEDIQKEEPKEEYNFDNNQSKYGYMNDGIDVLYRYIKKKSLETVIFTELDKLSNRISDTNKLEKVEYIRSRLNYLINNNE